jgi:type IV pilus assembly protein PilY1
MTDNTTPAGTVTRITWEEPTALFSLTAAADPGRLTSNLLYDYTGLGATSHVAIGQMRAGLEPVYAAFVATNNSGGSNVAPGSIELFAIDIATGQKLWQWEKPYTTAVQDGVPPTASLLPGVNGAVSRVFVGDQEGAVWELDATTGINVNNDNGDPINCVAPPCNYPAFNASIPGMPQPITTNIAIARVPTNASGALSTMQGATVLAFGTAGIDWAPAAAPGELHVVAWDSKYRNPLTSVLADEATGVLPEVDGGFPISYAGPQHVYGSIVASGNSIFYTTSSDIIGNDLSKVAGTTAGGTYQINMQTAASGSLSTQFAQASLANYGGLAVYNNTSLGQTQLIGLEVGKIANLKVPSGGTPSSAQSLNQRNILYQLLSWMSRFVL